MAFHSILFRTAGERVDVREQPQCFVDLALDQIVATITKGWESYNLTPVLHAPLQSVDAVTYRQSVMRDVERQEVFAAINGFTRDMRTMRQRLEDASTASGTAADSATRAPDGVDISAPDP